MNHAELFAGIGMWSYALGQAPLWYAECDRDCSWVMKKRFPKAQGIGDVRVVTHRSLKVDVLTAGWPCQDVSAPGTGAALSGARSGLWREVPRIIKDLSPRLVLLENVAALRKRGLQEVLSDLTWCGYDADWDILRATTVGAPHTRARIWIAAWPSAHMEIRGFAPAQLPPAGQLRNGAVQEVPSRDNPIVKPQWPTPTRADGHGGPGRQGREGGMNLRTAIRERGHRGPPSPEFVEWLMGIPMGWTDLDVGQPLTITWKSPGASFIDKTVKPRSVKNRGWRVGAVGNSHVPQLARFFAAPYISRLRTTLESPLRGDSRNDF